MTPFNLAIVRWIRGAFDFRSRATRSEYWWPRLLVAVVNLVCFALFVQGGGEAWFDALRAWSEIKPTPTDFSALDLPPLTSLSKFAAAFFVVFGLLTFIPDVSVAFRRFHDLGQPGWLHIPFMLFSGIFVFVVLIELIWFALPGQGHANKYGPDPLAGDQADIF